MSGKKKILVCPLDWGLGHAARDVPIIQRLADAGHKVILAADGGAYGLLASEFPELELLRLKSIVKIRYSRRLPAWLKITFLSPLLLYEVFAEHARLKPILRSHSPDIIISDNRYGIWSRKAKSILLTHQLSIRLPGFARFLEYPASLALKLLISRFDECWVPDYEEPVTLSGDLSHRFSKPANVKFIGAISRFAMPGPDIKVMEARPVDVVILLSGPEPQRTKFQTMVLKQSLDLNARCVILQGLPGKLRRTDLTSKVTMYNHLPAGEMKQVLQAASKVICRSGYTSIMDLALLGKKALLIPTPGQTEQEYLARSLEEKGMFRTCAQYEFDVAWSMELLDDFEPVFNLPEKDLLRAVIEGL